MSVKYPFQRVLWCVDVLAEDVRVYPGPTAALLEKLIDHHATEVELVYVLHPKAFQIPIREFPEWIDFYKGVAMDHLRSTANLLKWPIQCKLNVLVSGKDSQSHAAEMIVAYAKETKADLVALATHGRKGAKRAMLGSFAESLVAHSSIPLLIVDPFLVKSSRLKSILHATDLTEASRGAFRATLPIAKRAGVEVVLYHNVTPPFSILPPPGFIAQPAWDRVENLARESAARWAREAEENGVKVRVEISGYGEPLAKHIAEASQKVGADLITLQLNEESEKEFFGSHHIRKLVRETLRPILAIPV